MDIPTPTETLPLPFCQKPWRGDEQRAARAFWAWHQHLAAWTDEAHEEDVDVDEAARKAEAQEIVPWLPSPVCRAAYAACQDAGVPSRLLARQVRAAGQRRAPVRFERFADLATFMDDWAGAHARLLGHLAGLTLRSHQPLLDEMGRGLFLTRCIARLPDDLAADRVFLSMDELDQTGVDLRQLREGRVDEALRKLMWKQGVRARDALGQAQQLSRDLMGRHQRAFKRVWLGALEVITRVEKRDYDVWTEPVRLTRLARWQVHLQALVGKTSFR